jgi:hypothetical protein
LPDNTSGTVAASLSPQLAPAAPNPPADPDRAAVAAAWPDLPPHVRAAVLALVDAANRP